MNSQPFGLSGRSLYRVEQVRALDAAAIAAGVPGFRLMQQAGRAAWQHLRRRWCWASQVRVLAGGGNNGGDGLVLATEAARHGWPVQVDLCVAEDRLRGEARQALEQARAAAVPIRAFRGEPLAADAVLVDALLGNGLQGAVRGTFRQAIDWINTQGRDSGRPVLALDVPSGLDADSGRVHGDAVHASLTVTFVGDKPGLHTAEGPEYAGEVCFEPLDIPVSVRDGVSAVAELLPEALPWPMPVRSANGHKGRYGHVLCLGGGEGMGGAIRLCAEAALRAGAGLVSVRCAETSRLQVACGRPELMVACAADGPLDPRATVLAAGPGLGRDHWARACIQQVLADTRPLVLDADGLRLLDGHTFGTRPVVLTPHPGEAAVLLDCTVADVQTDRLQAAALLAERHQAVVVLKGCGPVIAGPDGARAVAPLALPVMGGPGFGDVLTGVIAALMAQGLSTWQAACNGVMAHGLAARRAGVDRVRGLLAGDLFAHLPGILS